jgi:dimeric dUTPase (all-alpha-NTP-PPase superfamily)
MIFKELFKEQIKLDNRIIKEHKLEEQDLKRQDMGY